ncbi:MAG: U32 family peptidase [Actinomycetota bacterium]|nr:U32 family peptidase [Actinomycetota bacterium]
MLFAHERGAKVFLTLNTLIKDSEIEEVAHFLEQYVQICQDGLIIQDLGIYSMIKDLFPGIRIHASTQLNIHNLDSVRMLESMGISRVVLAREMTISQIKEITENSNIEVEVFAHGSQCYSFSGQCYLSSFASGRSGNRGRCSQACRMKYRLLYKKDGSLATKVKKHLYYLSKKDLSAIDMIPELAASGVDALKIEGRMKTPEYVAIVTSIYRKYIDNYYSNPKEYRVEEKDRYKMGQIFLRDSGTGYLKNEYPPDIVNPRTSGSIGSFAGRIDTIEYSRNKKKVESILINSRVPIYQGDLLEIWTNKGNERITVGKIDVVKKDGGKDYIRIPLAKNIWVSENDRVFKYFDHKLDGEAKCYYLYQKSKPKVKKETRQPGLKDYELNFYLTSHRLKDFRPGEGKPGPVQISVNVYNLPAVSLVADKGVRHIIYRGELKPELVQLKEYCRQRKSLLFVSIPPIAYDSDIKRLKKDLKLLAGEGLANYELNSLGALFWINKEVKEAENLIMGRGLNIFNTLGVEFVFGLVPKASICEMELSNELNIGEITSLASRNYDMKFSMFGHGYFPVIVAKYKPEMLNIGYDRQGEYYLEDVKGYKFRLSSDRWGNILLFNSRKYVPFLTWTELLEVI